MKYKRSLISLITVVIVISFFASLFNFPVQADPGTIFVAPGGNCGGVTPCYGTIQEAVNASVNGDESIIVRRSFRNELSLSMLLARLIDFFTYSSLL